MQNACSADCGAQTAMEHMRSALESDEASGGELSLWQEGTAPRGIRSWNHNVCSADAECVE